MYYGFRIDFIMHAYVARHAFTNRGGGQTSSFCHSYENKKIIIKKGETGWERRTLQLVHEDQVPY